MSATRPDSDHVSHSGAPGPDPRSVAGSGSGHETIIVVPCYNEEHDLDQDAFVRFAERWDGRFLIVDDGSTDGTPRMLADLAARVPDRIEVRRLARNSGKAEAVRQGMLEAFARGPAFVGYWDADLATPLDEIPRFVDLLRERERLSLVLGARVKLLGRDIERKPMRHYGGRVFSTAASLTLDLPVYDTQCGAKLFRRTTHTEALFAEPFTVNWSFDVELLARLIRRSLDDGAPPVAQTVCELPLLRWRDVGESSVKPSDFFRSLWELARIRRRYRLWEQAGARR